MCVVIAIEMRIPIKRIDFNMVVKISNYLNVRDNGGQWRRFARKLFFSA